MRENLPLKVTTQVAWQAQVAAWAYKRGAGDLSDEFITFFEQSFRTPLKLYPRDAWFGIHANCISLTIGNMWLSAIVTRPRMAWMMTEPDLGVKGFGTHPIPSTLRYAPLDAVTAEPWDRIRALNRNARVWKSYAQACSLILQSPISRNVITRNLYRKARLADMSL